MKRDATRVKQAQQKCDNWNKKYPYPLKVILTDDDGVEHETWTRSEAWELCGSPVILVEGKSGGYLLDRIKPTPEEVTNGSAYGWPL